MADKQVFRLKKYLEQREVFAASLGLPFAPELPQQILDIQPPGLGESSLVDSDDDVRKRVLGGVIADQDAKNAKVNKKLDKFKRNIKLKRAENNDVVITEESDKRMTKRERRQQTVQEIKEKHKSGGVAEEELLVEKSPTDEQNTPAHDWRNDLNIRRAIRKQRVVIRADGTAKIKGAAMIPQSHIVFTDDGTSHDTNTFAGAIASMQNEREPSSQEDQSKNKRQAFIERMQARMLAANQELKAEKANSRKKPKLDAPTNINDLEAAVLAKLKG